MGMPRYLENKFNELVKSTEENGQIWELAIFAIRAGAYFNGKVYKLEDKITSDVISYKKYSIDIFKGYFKANLAKRISGQDNTAKIEARLYVGLKDGEYGKYSDPVAEFRYIKVSKFFTKKLHEQNAIREKNDRSELNLLSRIKAIQDKVYASRVFPPTLRAIIFERDKHCCQACGMHKIKLMKLGFHLEVDHTLAWEDGGKTCYKNGQTICSKCNIAKHHAKNYFRMKELLEM
ncbi:HNH endonuclease [Chromobacterium sp. CV08]|uniref:HNH endonuclease n=1 Tax=Chromobacterium sp. CV08 TaxID=3133274 RepID=UPI003DA9E81E